LSGPNSYLSDSNSYSNGSNSYFNDSNSYLSGSNSYFSGSNSYFSNSNSYSNGSNSYSNHSNSYPGGLTKPLRGVVLGVCPRRTPSNPLGASKTNLQGGIITLRINSVVRKLQFTDKSNV
jgi:hypothetical protein